MCGKPVYQLFLTEIYYWKKGRTKLICGISGYLICLRWCPWEGRHFEVGTVTLLLLHLPSIIPSFSSSTSESPESWKPPPFSEWTLGPHDHAIIGHSLCADAILSIWHRLTSFGCHSNPMSWTSHYSRSVGEAMEDSNVNQLTMDTQLVGWDLKEHLASQSTLGMVGWAINWRLPMFVFILLRIQK